MRTIEITPQRTERLTVEKFLRLTPEQRRKLKTISILAPRLDDSRSIGQGDDFGSILVERTEPLYTAAIP
jgi:hypothetical protein